MTNFYFKMFKKLFLLLLVTLLSACSSGILYQHNSTIYAVNPSQGYRLEKALSRDLDGNLIIVLFSGGGTRAAAFGYGVLEELSLMQHQGRNVLEQIDLVYGISGGSVLAAYFALNGTRVIPNFEKNFLSKNFQKLLVDELFSWANVPRLSSPQFGRGDLLQEQFNLALFNGAKFRDLSRYPHKPFVVISATDMASGEKVNFTQDFFDALCLDLDQMEIARAVAASSAVPLVFAPLTLNNNGGNCGLFFDNNLQMPNSLIENQLDNNNEQVITQQEARRALRELSNSRTHPYLHLIDGGIADNLGLLGIIELYDLLGGKLVDDNILHHYKKIIIISVNATNKKDTDIDKTANIPNWKAVANSVINVPIDRNSQNTIRRFRELANNWNKKYDVPLHFISISLADVPDAKLKERVLNISTSFYLPQDDIYALKTAAKILINNSKELKEALEE
ncbi:MAG: patatin-like phospholipase family protein [Cardiobacteriaceae bacterium]|nr:patatin-like phospholipase family protein [Cardiobacteriaceae bacterium]